MEFVVLAVMLLTVFGAYRALTHISQSVPDQFAPLAQPESQNAFPFVYSASLIMALLAFP